MPNQDCRKSQIKSCVIFPSVQGKEISLSPEARLEEAVRLAEAIWLDVVHAEIIKIREIKPSIFFGNGFLEKLRQDIEEKSIDLVIIDISSWLPRKIYCYFTLVKSYIKNIVIQFD